MNILIIGEMLFKSYALEVPMLLRMFNQILYTFCFRNDPVHDSHLGCELKLWVVCTFKLG